MNTGTTANPLIGGINRLFKLGICQSSFGKVGPSAYDAREMCHGLNSRFRRSGSADALFKSGSNH